MKSLDDIPEYRNKLDDGNEERPEVHNGNEHEDLLEETDDEVYNTVLHKYGMHRDGDKYRITR